MHKHLKKMGEVSLFKMFILLLFWESTLSTDHFNINTNWEPGVQPVVIELHDHLSFGRGPITM